MGTQITARASAGTIHQSSRHTVLGSVPWLVVLLALVIPNMALAAKVAAPTFSPGAGTYTNSVAVTISTTTSSATIRYTTNGTTPSRTVGTIYTGPVTVSANTTLKAIAYRSGWANSNVTTGVYTIKVAAPTFAPAAGTYASTQSVTISTVTPGASIRYTTDGTAPTSTTGNVYSGPVAISVTATLRAIAYKTGVADSDVTSGLYTINTNPTVPAAASAPTIDGAVDAGWSAPASLSITKVSGTISGASDCSATWKALWDNNNLYVLVDVTDDSKWNDSANQWDDDCVELMIDGGNEKAGSYDANDRQYVFGWGDTTAREAGGRNATGVVFAYADPTSTSYRIEIRVPWTAVGVSPVSGANIGIDVHVDDDDDGTARDGKIMWNDSADQAWTNPSVFGTAQLTGTPPGGVVASPSFSPAAGTYISSVSVTISSTTSGASIRYTTDGTTPTSTTGTLYSSPVALSANATLKAIAYKSGMTDSTVTSGVYAVKVDTPSFTPGPGSYGSTQNVTISTTTSGATIRYTTDGTTPTSSVGTLYSGQVSISTTTTLKAIAYKSGLTDSDVASGTYTIGGAGSGPHQIATRYIGMNFSGPGDNVRWPMFANVAKTGRYSTPGNPYGRDNSVLDSNGHPNKDFSYYLFDTNYGTIGNHGGTYTVKFNGRATIVGNGSIGTVATTYDSPSNTSTGSFTLPANPSHPYLTITATDRDGVGTNNDGVTNWRVMRPMTPGSGTSYPDTAVFTDQILNVARYFNCIREMSNIEAGGNDWEDLWSERVKPSEPQDLDGADGRHYGDPAPGGWDRPTHARGRAHEYMIRLANDADVDVFINIPVCASDDYVTKLAQLARYGSDGVNPYTSTQASPVYPPLEAGRRLYIELGNELWNWGSPYWYNKNWMHTTAKATTAGHPIRYDSTTDENILAYRWQAYRTMQISDIFRSVWGDANMYTVVRPIIGWQQSSGSSTNQLIFLHNYYNNGDGVSHVATPHTVNYFIWGGGGTFYNDPSPPNSPPLTLDEIFNNWNQATWAASNLYTDVTWCKTMGLAFFSYEGGPSLGGDSGGSIWSQAWADPRMTTEVLDTMYIIEDYGADGGNWLATGGNDPAVLSGTGVTWEYVRNVWNPTEGSPKMQGIDQANNTTVKRTPTVGVATGAGGFLAARYARDNWWPAQHDDTAASISLDPSDTEGIGYCLRATSAGTYLLSVQHSGNATTLRVIVNGVVAGTISLPASGSALWTGSLSINLGAGVNGLRIQNLTSGVTLYSLRAQ
jgi:hypothetical protein